MRFKLARTKNELESAFRLLHDAYVEMGYMDPTESGLRVSKHHTLPSTSTLIAVNESGEVVATVSVIRQGLFNLPIEEIHDCSSLKKKGKRLSEISALAIRKDYRRGKISLLFYLQKYLYEYCVHYFGTDIMLMTTIAEWAEFYDAILGFERMNKKPKPYGVVKDTPAVSLYGNLRELYDMALLRYGRKPPAKNLFHFFIRHKVKEFEFPDRTLFRTSDPVMTPELLNYFFNEKSDVFENLTDFEKYCLRSLYSDKSYEDIIPTPAREYELPTQRATRHDVDCIGRLDLADRTVRMKVKNVSETGFNAYLEDDVRFDPLSATIGIGDLVVTQIRAIPVWSKADKEYGFQILEKTSAWHELIHSLEHELLQKKDPNSTDSAA